MKRIQHPNIAKVNKKRTVYVPDLLEEQIHLAIAQYLDTVIKRPSRWHTVEVSNQASGWQAINRQKKLKAKGVRTGFPDITIFWRSLYAKDVCEGQLNLIFLEVKSAKGKLSEKQEALHEELKEDGHYVFVVRSVDDVKLILNELGVI